MCDFCSSKDRRFPRVVVNWRNLHNVCTDNLQSLESIEDAE